VTADVIRARAVDLVIRSAKNRSRGFILSAFLAGALLCGVGVAATCLLLL
jgi:hypothetical protein